MGRKSWEEYLAEQELLERKKERESIKEEKRIESEKILSKDEIRKYTKYGPKNPLLELDKMIGMDSVKEQINRLISQFLFEKERKNAGIVSRVNTCNHMCFLGPAGTGKTTVARIMTSILYQNGYIKENKMIEITGSQLTGIYLGQTKERTRLFIEAAKGGVLFLDEAYSLNTGTSGDSYSQEATAMLVKAMEDNKNDFVLIIAGYKDLTNRWLSSNEGLKSRIRLTIDFPDFTPDECVEILKGFSRKDNMTCSEELLSEYKRYISNLQSLSNKCKHYNVPTYHFSNARQVRNDEKALLNVHAESYVAKKIPSDKRDVFVSEDIICLKNECIRLMKEFDNEMLKRGYKRVEEKKS